MSEYVGVGADFDVSLQTSPVVDLSTASSLLIRYQKPDGTTGEVTATAGGSSNETATGSITAAINNAAGEWVFQLEAVISSKTYFSEPAQLEISTPITDPTP